MTNAQSASPQKHDLSVPYADEVVPGASIDVARWESWSHTDVGRQDFYAKGPCPACFAEAQGHAADMPKPLEGQGIGQHEADSERVAPSVTIEIPVRCQCGFGHGRQDATGCGRAWSLIIMRTTA
jgi:hypothetical protein